VDHIVAADEGTDDMTANDERIRTTHIGSLPRPPELLDLLEKRQNGEDVDADEWEGTVADATLDVVERQAEAGLGMVDPEIAWAKLEALVDGAAIATERIY
jgi:methionine synthase II (cobalamin-independent)